MVLSLLLEKNNLSRLKMKRILSLVLGLGVLFSAAAQNTQGSADDFGRIALTPVILDASQIPTYATKTLETKLTQIVTKNGMAAKGVNPRFVITANADLINKEVTATAPSMTVVELAVTLYIGDAQTGNLFASYTYDSVKGVDSNESKAYIQAFKRVSANASGVSYFVTEGKNKIIEYYNSQIDLILLEANGLAKSQKYDEAMVLLASVPNVCKDAYAKAINRLGEVYQQKIDLEGEALYNEAMALWRTTKTEDDAREVSEILAEINPYSSSIGKAHNLIAEIESHYTALEQERKARERRAEEFNRQRYEDRQISEQEQRHMSHEEEMARIGSGSAVSERALQEVKEIIGTMNSSNTTATIVNTQPAAFNNIKSWFK